MNGHDQIAVTGRIGGVSPAAAMGCFVVVPWPSVAAPGMVPASIGQMVLMAAYERAVAQVRRRRFELHEPGSN